MKYFLSFLVVSAFLLSCKKNNDPVSGCTNPNATNYNAQATQDDGSCVMPNYTCDGHPTINQYMPLIVGATWIYRFSGNNTDNPYTCVGTATFNSKQYFKVDFNELNGLFVGSKYYRVASNGDIFYYHEPDNDEYMLIPGNPTAGQEWPVEDSRTRKIDNMNGTAPNSVCTYTGCVFVRINQANGSMLAMEVYKKKVGLVASGIMQLRSLAFN